MCLQYVKVKSKSAEGIKYSYVPCGKCADCRRRMQNAWMFRMNSEFLYLKNQGWNVAFCTLTYTDDELPHVPEECFKDPSQYRQIDCFSRSQVREWIDSIRHYCKRHYRMVKGDNIRYFIASEYGEESHRPHYHAILAWPNRCDYETMHSLCTYYWNHGLLFPRDYRGDGNKCMSFEVIGDASKVLAYCSKYVCKDLAYLDETEGIEFYNHKDYEEGTDEYAYGKMYADTVPFHIQSKSLGFEPFKLMTDEEKLNCYINGKAFQGDGKTYELPVYIKNKLVFDPYYVKDEETGKRLSLRKANAFFEKFKDAIFTKKAHYAGKYLLGCHNVQYWLDRGLDEDMSKQFVKGISYFYKQSVLLNPHLTSVYEHGAHYLAYNAVDFEHCYQFECVDQWMLRYRTDEDNAPLIEGVPLYDQNALSWLKQFWNAVDMAHTYVNIVCVSQREEDQRLADKIRDYFNNIAANS